MWGQLCPFPRRSCWSMEQLSGFRPSVSYAGQRAIVRVPWMFAQDMCSETRMWLHSFWCSFGHHWCGWARFRFIWQVSAKASMSTTRNVLVTKHVHRTCFACTLRGLRRNRDHRTVRRSRREVPESANLRLEGCHCSKFRAQGFNLSTQACHLRSQDLDTCNLRGEPLHL